MCTACRWPACAASVRSELTHLGGDAPAIAPGPDPPDRHPQRRCGREALVLEHGLDIYDMRYIDEIGMRGRWKKPCPTSIANTHLHVSFDVDFLDPEIAPGWGPPCPAGRTTARRNWCMEMIADTGRLASLDIVELNPAFDDAQPHRQELAVDLVESLFGKSTLLRNSEPGARICSTYPHGKFPPVRSERNLARLRPAQVQAWRHRAGYRLPGKHGCWPPKSSIRAGQAGAWRANGQKL
jgi:hypothetical protein